MHVDVRIQTVALADAFRDYVERRLRFTLTRFASRIDRVVVNVGGVSEARGTSESTCNISVRLSQVGSVTVKETDADLFAATDRAVGRAEREVAHRLARGRELRTGRATARPR